MKKIIFSLAVIFAVGAIVIGATSAYFTDTETHAANVLQAGTIDISLSDRIVTRSFNIGDMKPGMTQWIEFDVHNDGVNPVVLRKRLTNYVSGTGLVSEPECTDQQGVWLDGQCSEFTDNNDLAPVMTYDMTLTLPTGEVVLIPETRNVKLSDVRDLWIPIGKLEAGETVHVKQSYHLDEATTNWAQGDSLTFDINILAEQRMGAGPTTDRGVVLENKTLEPDWYSIMDARWGLLTYAPESSTFDFNFRGFGLTPGAKYNLVWWNGSNEVVISGPAVVDSHGEVAMYGSKELNADLHDAKIWLRPFIWTSSSNANTLWEGNIVNFDDTDL